MPLHHWMCGILLYTVKKTDFQFILNENNDKIWTIEMCSF